MVASSWLNAAAKATPQGLDDAVSLTGYPFWYEGAAYIDAGSAKACDKVGDHGTAADATAARPIVDCLRHGTAPLLAAADWSEADLDALPAPLAKWKSKLGELAKTTTLVLVHATDKTTEDWAVFAVGPDRAHGAGNVTAFVAAHRGR